MTTFYTYYKHTIIQVDQPKELRQENSINSVRVIFMDYSSAQLILDLMHCHVLCHFMDLHHCYNLSNYVEVLYTYRIAGNFRWCKFSRIW